MSNNFYFKFELSYILVPLLGYIYINNKKSRSILLYGLVYIAIIGTINTIFLRDKIVKTKYGLYQYYATIIFHLVLLLTLLDFNKYGYPNLISFLVMVIGIIILKILPYWPYYLSRDIMIYGYILCYVILSIIYYLIKYIKK
jgi:hypothetical protein